MYGTGMMGVWLVRTLAAATARHEAGLPHLCSLQTQFVHRYVAACICCAVIAQTWKMFVAAYVQNVG